MEEQTSQNSQGQDRHHIKDKYDRAIEEVMRGDGLSVEPDYELIDRIKERRLSDRGIDPYAGLM